MSATGLMDPEESTKPTKSDLAGDGNDQCCNCPKAPEVKDRENDERLGFKKFENFLHNAIFLPRYVCAHEDTRRFTSRAAPVRWWLLGCRRNGGNLGDVGS